MGSNEQDNDNPHERRMARRVVVDLEVDYRNEHNFLFAYITDMSALGMFVRTHQPEEIGTRLNMRFSLERGETPISVEGEVMWINPFRPGNLHSTNPGMGVRFLNLDAQVRKKIITLVRELALLEEQSGNKE